MMRNLRFATPRPDADHDQVNFDIHRMQKAIAGESFSMPQGLSREEFREWMRENARKCRSK